MKKLDSWTSFLYLCADLLLLTVHVALRLLVAQPLHISPRLADPCSPYLIAQFPTNTATGYALLNLDWTWGSRSAHNRHDQCKSHLGFIGLLNRLLIHLASTACSPLAMRLTLLLTRLVRPNIYLPSHPRLHHLPSQLVL